MNEKIISKLKAVKTMRELDELRGETVKAMMDLGEERFKTVQKEFRKAKNRLRRIPLSQRNW